MDTIIESYMSNIADISNFEKYLDIAFEELSETGTLQKKNTIAWLKL